VLSDDKGVFALLVYWIYQTGVQCKVQIDRWDRIVLDVNAICAIILGKKCLQFFNIHTLSGCDTTLYHYDKGNITVLNNLFNRDLFRFG